MGYGTMVQYHFSDHIINHFSDVLKGIINIRYGIPMLLMTWSMAGLFAYHITRVTLEVVKLIIQTP